MKKPSNPQLARLGPLYQLCWLGLLTVFYNLLHLLWLSSIGHGWPLATAITGGALVAFLVIWRVLHARQQRRQGAEVQTGCWRVPESNPLLLEAARAHAAGHLAAQDSGRFWRLLGLMRTLAWCTLPVLATCGVLAWRGGALPMRATALLLAHALLLTLVLGLTWRTLLVAREAQAEAFAVKGMGERSPPKAFRWVNAKWGLALAAFASTAWWGDVLVLLAAPGSRDLFIGLTLGALAWGMWITYHFFWLHSRTLGSRDSGTLSASLGNLLFFCLPGLAFFVADVLFRFILFGPDLRHRVWLSMGNALLFVPALPPLALLFWAAGKLSLMSARERRRERPGFPRALLSCLVILALSKVLLDLEVARLGGPMPLSDFRAATLVMLHLLGTSLGVGLLAHRLSAPARASRRRAGRTLEQGEKPPNPQMAELGPFYQLCWLGLLLVLHNLLQWIWTMSNNVYGRPLAIAITGGAVMTFLVIWRVLHTRQKRGQQERAARGGSPARPRLQHRLDALRDTLRELSGEASARLVLSPEPAVVLSTLRSEREPVVEMTAGFWSTYESTPRLIDAALAHEAGHIAARDIERFLRMLNLMRAMAWFCLPVLALTGVHLWKQGGGPLRSSVVLLADLLLQALVLALVWSALLVAREVQADAFAVKALGEQRPMEALLESQLARRAAQADRRTLVQRLRTWLLQPDLRWRSTLPFLRGRHLGRRVEVKLGLALAAFAVAGWQGAHHVTRDLQDLHPLSLLPALLWVPFAWGSWIAYRFFWVRSRALGGRGPGTLSAGLKSLLCLCLPGLAFILVYVHMPYLCIGCLQEGVGGERTMSALWLVTGLLTLAVLFWAVGKMTLVSSRERRRERPSLPRALLSCLGLLIVTAGFILVENLLMGEPVSDYEGIWRVVLPLFGVSLGAGLLAHRLRGAWSPGRTPFEEASGRTGASRALRP